MALIKCTECGKEFSDKASTCPNCGCPTSEILKEAENKAESTSQKEDMQEVEIPEDLEEKKELVADKLSNDVEKKPKDKKKIGLIVGGIVVGVVIVSIVFFFVTKDSREYSKAQSYFYDNNYEDAKTIYEELGDYKDSATMVTECEYQLGKEAFSNEKFSDALKIFKNIDEYKDSADMIEQCNYELSVDGQFMRALSKGLMARWDKSDENAAAGITDDANTFSEFCQIELDYIEKFYDEEFENDSLQADARQYIDYLKCAQDATNQYTVNYTAFSETWSEVYASRTILLQKMVSDYGLTVDQDHQKDLDDILVDAAGATKDQQVKDDVAEMCESFEITSEKNEWGRQEYSLKMVNTTELTFDTFYVSINVLDDEGNIITSGSASVVNNWKPETETTVDVWFHDNEIDLNEYSIEYTAHYLTGTYYE